MRSAPATLTPPPAATAPARRRRRRWAIVAAAALALAASVAWWQPWRDEAPGAIALPVSGDIAVHDPALVAGTEDHDWYVYSTGDVRVGLGAPQIRRSADGRVWEEAGTAWDADSRPAWAYEAVTGVENFWAPELYEHDGTWYLYYSVSTFGSQTSAIGLATSPTIDMDSPDYGWTDQGMVLASAPGETTWNAIDPGIVEDADGTPWLAFGSWSSGIHVVELEWPSGMVRAGAEPTLIASRAAVGNNAIEAAYIARHDGLYYLFVSRDRCCAGVDSTYSIAVGRAETPTGPYRDSWGNDMRFDGGDEILATRGAMVGPGGQSVSDGHLAFHYYDADLGGLFQLGIRELYWTEDGWPVAWTGDELAD